MYAIRSYYAHVDAMRDAVAVGEDERRPRIGLRLAEGEQRLLRITSYNVCYTKLLRSHCIAHGINMQHGLLQQHRAVASGYWPLMRYNPEVRKSGENPFVLDSQGPRIAFKVV